MNSSRDDAAWDLTLQYSATSWSTNWPDPIEVLDDNLDNATEPHPDSTSDMPAHPWLASFNVRYRQFVLPDTGDYAPFWQASDELQCPSQDHTSTGLHQQDGYFEHSGDSTNSAQRSGVLQHYASLNHVVTAQNPAVLDRGLEKPVHADPINMRARGYSATIQYGCITGPDRMAYSSDQSQLTNTPSSEGGDGAAETETTMARAMKTAVRDLQAMDRRLRQSTRRQQEQLSQDASQESEGAGTMSAAVRGLHAMEGRLRSSTRRQQLLIEQTHAEWEDLGQTFRRRLPSSHDGKPL
ncbi:hypothetical protein BX600DRAFT_102329 [Xylariales sp. PMI_506]|nr:hypothetical protein BX600DRAFT_102329 [Xylariales sp. PMI_506]